MPTAQNLHLDNAEKFHLVACEMRADQEALSASAGELVRHVFARQSTVGKPTEPQLSSKGDSR